jgi:hypothetical protein
MNYCVITRVPDPRTSNGNMAAVDDVYVKIGQYPNTEVVPIWKMDNRFTFLIHVNQYFV